MFKTKDDGSILYTPDGWWSKKSYVLPDVQLKKRIRYTNLTVGLFLAALFLAAFFSANLLWVFAALLLVVMATIWHRRFERKWLINCEVVDERVTIIDVYREQWFVPEKRRWKRITDTIALVVSIILIGFTVYLIHSGVLIKKTALFESLTVFLCLHGCLLFCFIPVLYRQSDMTKALRSVITMFTLTSTLLIVVLCVKVISLMST